MNPKQNPLLSLGLGGVPGQSQMPPGMDINQYQLQQGQAQLQGLAQIINQKHQELMSHQPYADLHGLVQQHANLRGQLGV